VLEVCNVLKPRTKEICIAKDRAVERYRIMELAAVKASVFIKVGTPKVGTSHWPLALEIRQIGPAEEPGADEHGVTLKLGLVEMHNPMEDRALEPGTANRIR
jgi:hypothetical protein